MKRGNMVAFLVVLVFVATFIAMTVISQWIPMGSVESYLGGATLVLVVLVDVVMLILGILKSAILERSITGVALVALSGAAFAVVARIESVNEGSVVALELAITAVIVVMLLQYLGWQRIAKNQRRRELPFGLPLKDSCLLRSRAGRGRASARTQRVRGWRACLLREGALRVRGRS